MTTSGGTATTTSGGTGSSSTGSDTTTTGGGTNSGGSGAGIPGDAPQHPIELFVEGIYDNKNGTYTAYLSYVNTTPDTINIGIGNGESQHNFFNPGDPSKGQPIAFKPGTHRGLFYFTFAATESYTWSVRVPGFDKVSVNINNQTPKLPPVEPFIDCKQQIAASAENSITIGGAATMKGIFSYRNPNPFDIFLAVGPLNSFNAGKSDRGQPNRFFAGLNKAAFSAVVENGTSWNLPGRSAVVSEKVPECACTTTNNQTSKVEILTLSKELLDLAYEAADTLDRASRNSMNTLSKDERTRLKELLTRTSKRVEDAFAEIEVTLTIEIPQTSTACADVQKDCRVMDDGPAIDTIRQRYDLIGSMINRLTARAGFVETGDTRKYRKIRKSADQIIDKALAALSTFPRFRQVCGDASAGMSLKVIPRTTKRIKRKSQTK